MLQKQFQERPVRAHFTLSAFFQALFFGISLFLTGTPPVDAGLRAAGLVLPSLLEVAPTPINMDIYLDIIKTVEQTDATVKPLVLTKV